MKKNNFFRNLSIFFILSLLYSSHLKSQDYSKKFGTVTDYEMNMTEYSQDTTAAAVVLMEEADTRFVYNEQSGFRYKFEYQIKIKILKPEGVDEATKSISYTNINAKSREEISGLSGTTYNLEDGKITKTKLSKEYINDEKYDEKYYRRKFEMPGVKVGSVIEYKYTIYSDFFYDLREFNFQRSIPVIKTTYEITMPEYFRYNVEMRGFEKIEVKDEYVSEKFTIRYTEKDDRSAQTYRGSFDIDSNSRRYKFQGNNIPALKNEPFVWCVNDYISRVTFELQSIQYPHSTVKNFSSNWETIDKELLDYGSFGGNLKKTGLFKDIVKEFDGEENMRIKACKIQDMIRSKVKWNEKNRLFGGDLKDALKTGSGSNADMNFLLINALNAAGINAFPVIMSTRENGILPVTHPTLSALNYMITGIQIDTALYFTDASSKYGSLNILPQRCLVDRARIVQEKGRSGWVDLTKVCSGSIIKNISCKFEDGIYTGTVNGWYKDESAYDFRRKMHNHKSEEEYIEKMSSEFAGEIEDYSVDGINNTAVAVNEKFKLKTTTTLNDEYIYINALLEPQYTENIFKSEERKLPIDFNYLINFKENISIEVPEGYTIEELPKSERFTFDDKITCLFQLSQQSNTIILRYSFVLNEVKFLNTEYEHLKDFFAKIYAKNQEKIILKKI